ncbi:MAG: pilus assembly protein [Selenomonas sp.]|uniref:TadE/TadG family type IV pilus assembly protein n=1 Tax=Selenomonas sp. TaxID=2053611 RepID=UPI0025E2321B|nr:TadE/TadG family type IV pilus assembly protein [Selenomonas sp.]MCR5758498.1 pilus assembly protein [Selenomonas sp.]
MQKQQKGQSIVEFALVLPLLLLLVFGIFYTGMVMADYLTLSSIARSSAREAAVASAEDYQNNYQKVRDRYKKQELPMDVFTWQATNPANFKIEYNKPNVVVTMQADLNTRGKGLLGIINHLAGKTSLARINITYKMYSEYEP